MSNYTKSTNFAAKDSLPSGNAGKVVKGTEINTEFDNIATAIATKADLNSPTLVTPNLGTPSAAVLTNATGLPLTTGVTGTLPVANGGTGATTFSAGALLKGAGTSAITTATAGTDYAPATSGTSILKGNGSGGFSNAASGTDYAPATSGTAILKGNGTGGFSNAAAGIDYAAATTGTSAQLLANNGSGGFSNVTVGSGLSLSAGTLSNTASVSAATPTTLGTVYGGTDASSYALLGYQAGASNTTGANNVGVGYRALYANTTANNSTAVGYNALAGSNTNGSNTAVGAVALTTNTTGTQNVAVGGAAMQLNTTGSYNSALGLFALNANTTASNNTAIGYQAGYSLSTGNGWNTFVGREAGRQTTGDSNTFVGSSYSRGAGAGYFVTSGSKNTILGGYDGNQDGLDIRTASNYAVISDGDGNRLLSTANGYSLALDGGAVPQSGTGITFPATQSASSDANTLDDYEEGTWTPSIGGTATYTARTGTYRKIGSQVTCWFDVTINAVGTGSGALQGLPFANNASAAGGGNVGYFASLVASFVMINPIVAGGQTSVSFETATAATATIGDNQNIWQNSSRCTGFVTYHV